MPENSLCYVSNKEARWSISLADPKGALGTLGKIGQIIGWRPLGFMPRSGKSWMRHCIWWKTNLSWSFLYLEREVNVMSQFTSRIYWYNWRSPIHKTTTGLYPNCSMFSVEDQNFFNFMAFSWNSPLVFIVSANMWHAHSHSATGITSFWLISIGLAFTEVSIVEWLSRSLHTREVLGSSPSGNRVFFLFKFFKLILILIFLV